MTQEDKKLLFKDICARLPYGVKTTYSGIIMEISAVSSFLDNMCCLIWDSHKGYYNQTNARIGEFKPYLRPMKSMTEEESVEYSNTKTCHIGRDNCTYTHPTLKTLDWLNKKMFDYRDLIPMGLALEAPEGMYK